jgi:transposase
MRFSRWRRKGVWERVIHAVADETDIVERFFSRIKHFRRVATRYDKLAGNYLAFASLACAFGPLVRM